MTTKRVLLLAFIALLAVPWAHADAYWRGGVWIGPGYYRPYPVGVYVGPTVVVEPAPIVVAPVPRPVYVVQPAPQPVYVQPGTPPAVSPPPAAAPSGYQALPPQPVPVQ